MTALAGALARGSTALGAQQQLLEPGGDGVPLTPAERLEEGSVGGDHRAKGPLGEPATLGGQMDAHGSAVVRIGCSPDQPGPLQPVEAGRHGTGGDQRGLGKVTRVRAQLVFASPQRVQYVEVAEAESEGLEGRGDRALEVGRAQEQPSYDLDRAGVDARIALRPCLHDAVHGVPFHLLKNSLVSAILIPSYLGRT
jgi:hypothetical protein